MNTMTTVGHKSLEETVTLFESKKSVVTVTFKKTVTITDLNRLYLCSRRNISMSDVDWLVIVHALASREWSKISREFEITVTGSPDENRKIATVLFAVAENIELSDNGLVPLYA